MVTLITKHNSVIKDPTRSLTLPSATDFEEQRDYVLYFDYLRDKKVIINDAWVMLQNILNFWLNFGSYSPVPLILVHFTCFSQLSCAINYIAYRIDGTCQCEKQIKCTKFRFLVSNRVQSCYFHVFVSQIKGRHVRLLNTHLPEYSKSLKDNENLRQLHAALICNNALRGGLYDIAILALTMNDQPKGPVYDVFQKCGFKDSFSALESGDPPPETFLASGNSWKDHHFKEQPATLDYILAMARPVANGFPFMSSNVKLEFKHVQVDDLTTTVAFSGQASLVQALGELLGRHSLDDFSLSDHSAITSIIGF